MSRTTNHLEIYTSTKGARPPKSHDLGTRSEDGWAPVSEAKFGLDEDTRTLVTVYYWKWPVTAASLNSCNNHSDASYHCNYKQSGNVKMSVVITSLFACNRWMTDDAP